MYKFILANSLAIFLAFILLSACKSDKQVTYKSGANFAQVKGIFTKKCSICHVSFFFRPEETWKTSGDLIPGDPKKSKIISYLQTSPNKKTIAKMHTKLLAQDEKKLISEWIQSMDSKASLLNPSEVNLLFEKITLPKAKKDKRLSSVAHYSRCYAHFVRERTNDKDPLLLKVKNKKLTSTQACMQLLNNATLNSNGILKSSTEELGAKILLTFQSVHNNWFPSFNLHTLSDNWPTFELLDTSEMGLFFTSALFSRDKKYSEIFTAKNSLESVREHKLSNQYLFYKSEGQYWSYAGKSFVIGKMNLNRRSWEPTLLSRGKLVGIRPVPLGRDIIESFVLNKTLSLKTNSVINDEPFDIHQGFGGGVLGIPPYVSLNLGRRIGVPMDGGFNIPRRWSRSIFSDFMCRSLPVIQPQDGIKYLKPKAKILFRRSKICMQCHASIDSMAGLLRNVQSVLSSDAGFNDEDFQSFHIRKFKVVAGDKLKDIFVDPNEKYHTSPPQGILYYRNLYGELIDKKIKNLDELSQLLLKEDDIYVCTAKRYFHFLTGINVAIADLAQKAQTANKESLIYLKLLLSWGKELKKSQNLKKLILNIIDSDIYRDKLYKPYL